MFQRVHHSTARPIDRRIIRQHRVRASGDPTPPSAPTHAARPPQPPPRADHRSRVGGSRFREVQRVGLKVFRQSMRLAASTRAIASGSWARLSRASGESGVTTRGPRGVRAGRRRLGRSGGSWYQKRPFLNTPLRSAQRSPARRATLGARRDTPKAHRLRIPRRSSSYPIMDGYVNALADRQMVMDTEAHRVGRTYPNELDPSVGN